MSSSDSEEDFNMKDHIVMTLKDSAHDDPQKVGFESGEDRFACDECT